MMLRLSKVVFANMLPDPSGKGFERKVFEAKDFDLVLEGSIVTITHRETKLSIQTNMGCAWVAEASVPAAEPKKVKRG
jgi:hypothetical protein